ncbi:MAG: tRNA lysidine(34) synthetase TilS [Bacilli bacterium]|nr:tRNA lysidine(34) synthetase TilS [Bacilli bacterium]
MKDVLLYIESLKIPEDDYVVCAISGGPDSMCLLDLLVQYKQSHRIHIVCAHVNHNMRIESNDEEIFVKEYCDKNDVIFEYMKINEYDDDNFHNCARNIRYNFFESLVKKYQSKYLFTAHHGDDLMETVLMRIMRGSTLKGYGGFERLSKKQDYMVVRPLITMTKQQIEDYDKENNIEYVIDKSNFKDVYTRNRYRKYILPRLKDENKKAHLKFLNFSEYLIESGNYFENQAKKICKSIYVNHKLDITSFKSYEHVIQMYIIYYILELEYQNDIDKINNKHVNNIITLINHKGNGTLSLPGKKGIKEYDYFYIKNIEKVEYLDVILNDKILLPNGHSIEKVDYSELKNNNVIYLNSKDIELPLHIRYRKQGDRMKVKNSDFYKKINDIFIDKKISRELRDTYPIVVDNKNEIIWLPGLKKSHFDSQNTGKYDIILKYN